MAVRVARLPDNSGEFSDSSGDNRHDRRSQAALRRADPLYEALVTYPELKDRFGIPYDRSTIYKKRQDKTFPEPLQLSPGTIAWRVSDIEEWLASRPRAGDAPSPSKTKAKTKKRAAPTPRRGTAVRRKHTAAVAVT